jgi:hypothetical protein
MNYVNVNVRHSMNYVNSLYVSYHAAYTYKVFKIYVTLLMKMEGWILKTNASKQICILKVFMKLLHKPPLCIFNLQFITEQTVGPITLHIVKLHV